LLVNRFWNEEIDTVPEILDEALPMSAGSLLLMKYDRSQEEYFVIPVMVKVIGQKCLRVREPRQNTPVR
jgi:hypothetical protein